MASDINYDEEYMNSISTKYQDCVTTIDDIILHSKNAKSYMGNQYHGQAKEINNSIFDTLLSHLNLLSSCCAGLEDYVKTSLQTMQEADR